MPRSERATTCFQQLTVWRKGHGLALAVYEFTAKFPPEEKFGLVSQFRRAAVSVSANIAEGYRKRGRADKLRLLNVAEASLSECRCYLLLARDLGYGNRPELFDRASEVERLLVGYSQAIARDV